MFRKPGEDSSSEDEASISRDETNASAEDNLLLRINTVDSARSASSGFDTASAVFPVSGSKSVDNMRDLILHSLLEDKATREAAEHLGKERSDPEVQELARETYKRLAQQLPGVTVNDAYASDEMSQTRAAAQEGINTATRLQLTSTAAKITGESQALIPRSAFGLSLPSFQHPIPQFLKAYPGLHSDRYAHEYEELEVVGKGGYGKVYKVKHKLDNSFYAVKKIAISASKMQKIQDGGVQEMESLLEEVRSLARFDHVNIVRYHSAWLEFSVPSPIKSLAPERLLQNAAAPSFSDDDDDDDDDDDADHLHENFDSLTIFQQPSSHSDVDVVFETSDAGADIVFEASDTGAGAEESAARLSDRLSGHAETLENEEEIETIPRSQSPTYEESESMLSNSDMPHRLISSHPAGPILTLNVQMSLYESNLAAFLSTEQALPSHCFHLHLSLQLLDSIVSGVQYLHSRGVVHRDLKPANIFLSLSTDRYPPAGSVDLSTCGDCPARHCLHVTPRIGDFGLVAALGDGCLDAASKPVGTEFYRPPTGGKISEKLDVFALGVVAVEMLVAFGTKMERVDALTKVRRGDFPVAIKRLGGEVLRLVAGMVGVVEKERWGCEEVKVQIGKIVGG
jgi:translation initiation factor 2-alpha kinase 3